MLFRTLAQGRTIEEVLSAAGIPCQLASRRRLTDAPHVAGLVSLLRVVGDRGSLLDLKRILPWMETGAGVGHIDAFKQWCYTKRFSLAEGLYQVSRLPVDGLTHRRQNRLVDLAERLTALKTAARGHGLVARIRWLVENTPLAQGFSDPQTDGGLEAVVCLAEACRDEADFISRLTLCADSDLYDERAQRVALMSLHAAKGLEFPVVFIAGCEDGLIPLRRPGVRVDLAEERRLFYVGLTRSSQRVFLCAARRRQIRGAMEDRRLSPFAADIEARLKHDENPHRSAERKSRQTQLRLF